MWNEILRVLYLLLVAAVVLPGWSVAGDASMCSGRVAQLDSVRVLLGLEYPYSIERLGKYADGGSYGGMIRDASGRELFFAWDGRDRAPSAEGPRLSYIGAEYPAVPRAKPLGVGTPKERALICVLRSFADVQIARANQDSLYTLRFLDNSRPWEARAKLLGPLTAKQQIALDALCLARYLEQQARPVGFSSIKAHALSPPDDYAVYNAFIAQAPFATYSSLVIQRETYMRSDLRSDREYLKAHFPELSPSTIDTLLVRNECPIALQPKRFNAAVVLIDRDQLSSLFDPDAGEGAFRRQFPGTPKALGLSRVAFDQKGPYALLYYETHCGPECGRGSLVAFKLVGDKWISGKDFLLWVH